MRPVPSPTRVPSTREPGGLPPVVRWGPGLRSPLALALGCHGRPERCLRVGGRRMPLCARCTGIVGGNLAALPYFALQGFPGPSAIFWALALLLPVLVDGGLQALTGYRSTNRRRLATGFAAGLGQALVAVGILAGVLGLS